MNKKYIFLAVAVVVVIVGAFVVKQQVVQPMLDDRTVEEVVGTSVNASEYDFDFKYPSGIEGYVLIEPPVATTSQSLRKAYLLFEYQRYLTYQNAQEGEGSAQTPPAISVFVFTLPETEGESMSREEELLQWMTENPQYTSYDRKVGEVTQEKVDGVSAYVYSTEGPYQQDFHVMSYRGNVYVFAAQYEDAADINRETYQNLINSVTFY